MFDYLLVDGHNFAWRAGSVMFLRNEKGESTSVTFGMLSMIRSLLEDYQPKSACVCWDLGGAKAKSEVYPMYKQERKQKHDMPDFFYKEILVQINELQKMLPYFGLKQLIKKGVEADDLIGTLCDGLDNVLVVSSDKGMFQVIETGACLFYPPKNILVNRENFEEVVGIECGLYPYFLTLTGHSGGGVPGLEKFGKVTAKRMLEKYGAWIDWFTGNRIRAGVLEDLNKSQKEVILNPKTKEILVRNYQLIKLGYLVKNMKDEILSEFHSQEINFNEEKIKEFFFKNQFASYLARFHSWIHPFRKLTLRKNG